MFYYDFQKKKKTYNRDEKPQITTERKIRSTLQMGFFQCFSSLLVCRIKMEITGLFHSTIYYNYIQYIYKDRSPCTSWFRGLRGILSCI